MIYSQAVDAGARFAVTGGDDHTARVWSIADGKLLQTIRIPLGPSSVGIIYAVAITPDGSTIAAGGWTSAEMAHARSICSIVNPETSFSG
jgi:WD40 repeat protein